MRGVEADEPPGPQTDTAAESTARPEFQSRVVGLWGRLRRLLRLRRLYFLRAELKFTPTEAQRLVVLTAVIGVVCGLAAVAFHMTIQVFSRYLIDVALARRGHSWIAWTIVIPVVGSLVCGALLYWVVPNARGSGIPQVKAAFAVQGGRLRMRDAVGKFAISALQIGSGSSLGREGPTVLICASVASTLGRLTGVSPKSLRRLIPVGAAAGIAAAFNAPIAAVTFTIEEVVGNLDQAVLSGVIIAAALAAVIERSVLGAHPVFHVPQNYGLHHASSLLIYAIIGVAAAGVSLLFTESLLGLRARFRRSRIPAWAQPGVGGLVTGVLAAATFGTLGVSGVTGGGYSVLGQALTGQLAVKAMLVLCVMKIVATVSSYASGGAGGIFAPSLFIGGTLGGALGSLDHLLLGHTEPIGAFALVGMGAVFSGVIRAPMTSVLIIVEMTGGYSLILPLMLANMTAYILARRVRPTPIYEALLEQDGTRLRDRVVMDSLEGMTVGQIARQDGAFCSFVPVMPAAKVLELLAGSPAQQVYAVLDASGGVVGVITRDEIDILRAEPALLPLTNVADFMRPPATVRVDDDLRIALDTMVANAVAELVVTDAAGQFVGLINEAAIAKAHLHGQGVEPKPAAVAAVGANGATHT